MNKYAFAGVIAAALLPFAASAQSYGYGSSFSVQQYRPVYLSYGVSYGMSMNPYMQGYQTPQQTMYGNPYTQQMTYQQQYNQYPQYQQYQPTSYQYQYQSQSQSQSQTGYQQPYVSGQYYPNSGRTYPYSTSYPTGDRDFYGNQLCVWSDYPTRAPCGTDPQQWLYDPYTGTWY